MHREVRKKQDDFARDRLKSAGYKPPKDGEGDADVKRTKSAVGQHESHLHKGEKKTKLKLRRRGGEVQGDEPEARLDHRARGGGIPKGGKKAAIAIHIHNGATPEEKAGIAQQAQQKGMQIGAALGARKAAQQMQRPPMPGGAPGAGGPPPQPGMGGPPGAMPPPPGAAAAGLKKGGTVKRQMGGPMPGYSGAPVQQQQPMPMATGPVPQRPMPGAAMPGPTGGVLRDGGEVKVRSHTRRARGGAAASAEAAYR